MLANIAENSDTTPVKVSCCTIEASKVIKAEYNLTRKLKT
jgi:hypothetical protein